MADKKDKNLTGRKLWKKNARHVLKTHYVFLLIICLVAIMYGTESGYITAFGENLYSFITDQEIDIGGRSLKLDTQSSKDKVLEDLINDNISAGRYHAANRLQNYKDSKVNKDVLGRKNGIFASIANDVASGNLYMTIFSGLHSVVHSTRLASAIVVFISLLISIGIWIFVKNVITGILRRAFLEARLYEKVPVTHLLYFKLVHRWVRASMTLFIVTIFETLWAFTIIGGIIKHYSYFMVPYIVAENPDIKPLEAITLSRKMMYGHKWECFKADFSFLGWIALGVFTFGISEALWGFPYRMATFSEYYVEIRRLAKENGIEGADRLNDDYLFEKAGEDVLRQTYKDVEEVKAFIDENRVELSPVRAFFARNFGLWTGSIEEKKIYDEVDNRRQQIVEDRAAIKGNVYPQRLNPLWDEDDNRIVRDIRYLRTYTFWSIVMVFFIFSFIGWAWEVGLHLVNDGVFVNRGVSHGPWLPIYGGGVALIMVCLARWRSKPYVEVVSIVLLCGFVEYMTSWYLEVTKGMRWWDYTGYFLNINGRICGEGLMVFALGGMAAVYLLVPILDSMLSKVKPKVLITICIILLVIFAADMVYSSHVPNIGEGITDYAAYTEAG